MPLGALSTFKLNLNSILFDDTCSGSASINPHPKYHSRLASFTLEYSQNGEDTDIQKLTHNTIRYPSFHIPTPIVLEQKPPLLRSNERDITFNSHY